MATKSRTQPLPAKEEGLHKQVIKLYESKQYKKGIKTADQILKKFPQHGETLAFKSLMVSNYPERRDEAHELAKAALKADIQSFMCWHVYGLLHRTDRNYEQAAKCYMNAVRMDPNNVNVLRDLCNIQMQLRDHKGLVDTASKVLSLKSNQRNHWLMLAIAYHLSDQPMVGVQVIDSYFGTLDANASLSHPDRVEVGEVELYKAQLMRAAGDPSAALKTLTDRSSHICDRLSKLEMQADILLELGNLSEAQAVFRRLIAVIPDNYKFHYGLLAALQLPDVRQSVPPDVLAKLEDVYRELREQYPDCAACQRIPLDFLSGEDFAAAAAARIHAFVARGVPSLFSDLKPLLADAEKASALWASATAFLSALGESSGEDAGHAVWLHLYLAQHAAHVRDLAAAIKHICAAEGLAADPATAVDVFSAKADVLSAAGDPAGAAAAAEVARELDLKDRYANSMAAKFWFRAGEPERARETALLFAMDLDGSANNLHEMQVLWYAIERGRSFAERGDLGMALKMFTSVAFHFAEFTEDQYDFHNYCLRKVTLRAYIEMLTMEDKLYSQATYCDAAVGAIDCYLQLHDNGGKKPLSKAEEDQLLGLTEAQKKRVLDKKAKDAAKKAKIAADALEKERAAHNAKKNSGTKFDDDPLGEKLLKVEKPLAEVEKLVAVLRKHAGHRMATHKVAFEYAMRQNSPFLAMHAVKHALHLEPGSPDAHRLLSRLMYRIDKRKTDDMAAVAAEVLMEELQALSGGCTCEQLNDQYMKSDGSRSLEARLAVAEVQLLLDSAAPARAAVILVDADLSSIPHSVEDCTRAYKWIKSIAVDEGEVKQFFKKAQAVHRWSSVFDGPDRLPLPVDGLVEKIKATHIDK